MKIVSCHSTFIEAIIILIRIKNNVIDALTFYVSLVGFSGKLCNHIDHRDNGPHHALTQHVSLDDLQ